MPQALHQEQIHKCFRATAGCFFILGWLIPTLFAQFPTVRDKLGIEEWHITLFILSTALGAIPSMIVGSLLIHRIGSRNVALIFLPLLLLFPVAFVLVPSYPLFLALGCGLGICSGFLDVSANSQGSLLERATDHLFMTRIHALFAFGVLVGSALATLAHLVGLHLALFFLLLCLVSALHVFFIWRDFLPLPFERAHEQEEKEKEGHGGRTPAFSLFLLAALALLMLLGVEVEAAHYDWLALYFTDLFPWKNGEELPRQWSNFALVCFSSGLLTARILGDAVANRIGRPNLLRGGTLLGLTGLVWLIGTQTYVQGLIATALMGFGFAFFFPVFVAAAGRLRGIRPSFGVALVSAMGWASVFIGPPLIGLVEHYYGFRWAYATLLPVVVIVAIFGPWVIFKSRPGNH